MNAHDVIANGGWINLYQYFTKRIHAGTGVYATKEEADIVAKHKTNRTGCAQFHPQLLVRLKSVAKRTPTNDTQT